MTKEDLEILSLVVTLALVWASWPWWAPYFDRWQCRRFWKKHPDIRRGWRFYQDNTAGWDQTFKAPQHVLVLDEALRTDWVLRRTAPGPVVWVRARAEATFDPKSPETRALWHVVAESITIDQKTITERSVLTIRSLRKELSFPQHQILKLLFSWLAVPKA